MFLKTRGKSKATNFVLNLINMDLILTERGGGGVTYVLCMVLLTVNNVFNRHEDDRKDTKK